jgi:hypothetical protein
MRPRGAGADLLAILDRVIPPGRASAREGVRGKLGITTNADGTMYGA